MLRRYAARQNRGKKRQAFIATIAAALFCAIFLLVDPGLCQDQTETASEGEVYKPSGLLLILPESWRPTGVWAQDPAAEEQPEGLLFSAEAFAPTGETVTEFTINRLPPIGIPAEAFSQMTPEEQQQFCDDQLQDFRAALTEYTGVEPVNAKAMLKKLGDWHALMLTARFITGDKDFIVNQIAYSLLDRLVVLTFYTDTPLIGVMAADMAYILENFQPDATARPLPTPQRKPNEPLIGYLERIKHP